MTATLTLNGRLPGVLCQMALPPQPEEPLRLDAAGLVGFAERGPLNTPILVEDAGQYSALFGGDLVIARQQGAPVYANLPRAVAAFFDNGGRRCYVVRVAGDQARPNRFHLPGMVEWGSAPCFTTVTAAWVGRWSDGMSINTQLRALPLKIGAGDAPFTSKLTSSGGQSTLTAALDLETPTRTYIKTGDLLRLRFGPAAAPTQMVYFPVARSEPRAAPTSTLGSIAVTVHSETPVVFALPAVLPTPPLSALEQLTAAGWATLPTGDDDWGLVPSAQRGILAPAAPQTNYTLILPRGSKVAAGDLLRVQYTADTPPLLLPVTGISWVAFKADDNDPNSPGAIYPQALAQQPMTALAADDAFAVLGSARPNQVDLLRFDLRIGEGDQIVEVWTELGFGAPEQDGVSWRAALAQMTDDAPPATLETLAGHSLRLRAAPSGAPVLPLSMSEIATFATPLPDNLTTGKDGLDIFAPEQLFLDPQLQGVTFHNLRDEADNILYLRYPPGKLAKLHSLHAVDEIGLVAIPDLVHLGFPGIAEPPLVTPEPPAPPTPPDTGHFAACPPPHPPSPPLPGLPAVAPCANPFAPPAPPPVAPQLPTMQPPQEYNLDALLAVHNALIDFCAARGDRMAILTLPRHFGQREALAWQTQITQQAALDDTRLSYAAVYHPWLEIREETTPQLAPLRALPPDGAVCGMIAGRELARGPWIAPANEPLAGVVRLHPPLSSVDWEALFNRHINVVRQQPGRFTPLSAHTLSSAPLLLQISVRRLLIYLRKLALRRGEKYVFENNTPRFRQAVQLSFERTLTTLAQRGALVAFEVNAGHEYNSEQDEFNGRLIIAIKIAPTNPIEFITVALLRSGDSLLTVIER